MRHPLCPQPLGSEISKKKLRNKLNCRCKCNKGLCLFCGDLWHWHDCGVPMGRKLNIYFCLHQTCDEDCLWEGHMGIATKLLSTWELERDSVHSYSIDTPVKEGGIMVPFWVVCHPLPKLWCVVNPSDILQIKEGSTHLQRKHYMAAFTRMISATM